MGKINRKLPSAPRHSTKTEIKSPTKIHMLIQQGGIVLHSKWYYATAQILTQTISLASFFLFAIVLTPTPSNRSCHTIFSKLFILLFRLDFFGCATVCLLFLFSCCDSFSSSPPPSYVWVARKKKEEKSFCTKMLDKYLSNPVKCSLCL